jgi:hypothetical protein
MSDDSSRKEERKKETHYYNSYYNNLLSNNKKSYYNKSFSFPKTVEVDEIFQKLDEIARRDRWTKSQTFLVALKEFVTRHQLPNPQAQIDRILKLKLPHKPINICCVPNCRGKAKFRLQLQDFGGKTEMFHVCERHKNWRHPQFRFLISYGEISK